MSNIVVYGLGKTGQSLKKLLESHNILYLYDDDPFKSQVRLSEIPFDAIDLLIVSPGVKPDSFLVLECKRRGIEIQSELQFCFQRCPAKCISVTGTNGKTTITEMIHHALQKLKAKSRLLGNGGTPFAEHVAELCSDEVVVLESSSFQLNFCESFAPYISLISNIEQDHLDYHLTYKNYLEAKCKNFLCQNSAQFAVFNADDTECAEMSRLAFSQKLFYSLEDKSSNCFVDGDDIVVCLDGETKKAQCSWLKNHWKHNVSNFLAATLVCCLLGQNLTEVLECLQDFSFAEHRMMVVDKFNNVTFVDDSKSTNIHSAIAALKCIESDTVLILGGSEKGLSFEKLFNCFQHVSLLVLIGQTAKRIFVAAKQHGMKNLLLCESLSHAVFAAYEHLAKKGGGTVLLSPACASFDMFKDYKDRGEKFAECVKALREAYAN